MKKNAPVILSSSICSCRVIDVPPVGASEMEQIIRHRMTAFYPGSPDDLYRDYVREGDRAVVFFAPRTRIDALREESGNALLYSPWHLFSPIENKEGYYALRSDDRTDLFLYRENRLVETRTVESPPDGTEIHFVSPDKADPRRMAPLFQKRKKRNYLLFNLVLIALIVCLPQLALYRQTSLDEAYASRLKNEISSLTIKRTRASSSEEEFSSLADKYKAMEALRPLDIPLFLSDLSTALGRDVTIDSLMLKGNSFQLNGEGFNPLGKMEKFKENKRFSKVLPYQVKAIEDTSRKSFSLTGVFHNE